MKESPQMAKTQINWTAAASNPRKEVLFYNFNLNGPSTNYTWENVQNWSTQNWWYWHPTEPGNYTIEVQVSYGTNNGIPDSRSTNYAIFPFSEAGTLTGLNLYKMGQYDEAIKAYDKAIEINPQESDAWNNRRELDKN